MAVIPPLGESYVGGTYAAQQKAVCRTFSVMVSEVDSECVATRLRALMIDLNLKTVQELADLVGTERTTVQTWLRGANLPRVPDMARLRDKAGVTLDWIYTGAPEGLTVGTFRRLQAILERDAVAGRSEPSKKRRRQKGKESDAQSEV